MEPIKLSIAEVRREFTQGGLDESQVDDDPVRQFRRWFDEAVTAQVEDVNAMTLATVDAQGRPDARIVLLKGVEDGVFQFFTNYESIKGQHLAARPEGALLFFWGPLERQVRLRGPVERLDEATSDAYFASRPRGSQIGAWASRQSERLDGRAALEAEVERFSARYPAGTDVPRPPHWGGYGLRPTEVEFWQGRANRLHDRLRYTLHDGGWRLERLSS